jgi:leader peptidase (prepilin peptidase)/N-methyltransferase
MIDLKHYIIPDEISIFTIITGLMFFFIIGDLSFKSLGLAFLIGGGFLFIIAVIGPMGGGDIKIMAGFALYLGLERTILALMLSFILGGVIGLLLILLKIKGRKDYMPFGPFLGLGTLISFIYFNEIFTWYINILR